MIEDTDIKKNSLVVQSNVLIEASYKLNLQEKRLILVLISRIEKDDEDFKLYSFKVQELAKLFEIKDDAYYSEIQNITKTLMSKILGVKQKDGGLLQVAWLSSAEYKGGSINLEFSPRLKPYLLKIKECFTQYYLEQIVKLKSIYSIRIYELLKQYLNTEHKTRIFEIQDLREKLGLIEYDKKNNIISEKFQLYANIKQKILLPAQKELKESNGSDIFFNFEEAKKGRKVTAVKFYIIQKEKKNVDNGIKEQGASNEDYEFNKIKVNLAVEDMLEVTGDEKSKDYFYKVAWKFIVSNNENSLRQAISEFKADCQNVKNKGAAFTTIVKRIAKEAKIEL